MHKPCKVGTLEDLVVLAPPDTPIVMCHYVDYTPEGEPHITEEAYAVLADVDFFEDSSFRYPATSEPSVFFQYGNRYEMEATTKIALVILDEASIKLS